METLILRLQPVVITNVKFFPRRIINLIFRHFSLGFPVIFPSTSKFETKKTAQIPLDTWNSALTLLVKTCSLTIGKIENLKCFQTTSKNVEDSKKFPYTKNLMVPGLIHSRWIVWLPKMTNFPCHIQRRLQFFTFVSQEKQRHSNIFRQLGANL